MKTCNKATLLAFLEENGLRAKKNASQNFLVDGNIIEKICRLGEVEKGDFVVEIGPGPGALTEALLDKGASVIAIERDAKLAGLLRRFSSDESRLRIFTEDFLSFPLEETLKNLLPKGKKAKVIANLPYHITTPIFAKLIPLHEQLSKVVVMIQKEVAIRCAAKEGSKDYGSLSLFLRFHGEMKYGFTVSPNCFYPRPAVDSAVVHFTPLKPQRVEDEEFLFKVIRLSFQKRRKMLRSSLKEVAPAAMIEEALQSLHLNPLARPEDLSLESFILFASSPQMKQAQKGHSE